MNCEKTISLVSFLARSLYISYHALTYCSIERISCGYAECLDFHNSVNIDAIDLEFKSNIVEDISIGINPLDCDRLIGKLGIRKVII